MKEIKKFLYESIVCEHFTNLIYSNDGDIEKMREYSKEVWDMCENAYAYCGGVAGCKTYDDFCKEYVDCAERDKLFWKMITRNNKVTAIKIYTLKRGGRKGIIVASDGTEQGNADIKRIIREDFTITERDAWDELSGKALGAALKQGAIPMPSTVAKCYMPDKDIEQLPDGYFYIRTIGGKKYVKIITAVAKSKAQKESASPELIEQIKTLGKHYMDEFESAES